MLFHYLPLKSMESAQKIIPGILRLLSMGRLSRDLFIDGAFVVVLLHSFK